MNRLRDHRGRFVKVAKAPPLDPALVSQLGQGRPAVMWISEREWKFACWLPEGTAEETDGRIQ